jgi:hypothetical protein
MDGWIQYNVQNVWDQPSIHRSAMALLQWYDGKDDKNLKAHTNYHLCRKHIELGSPKPKNFV